MIAILTALCGLLLFFFSPAPLHAAESDVLINEIAAYESSDYEWIELYNKGTEKVDLTGWKFYEEATNHKLTVFRGSFTIDPGAYAVIANDASKVASKYPAYTGTILDSSWSSLSEKGEEIGLKNASGKTIEQFTYVATSKGSLERKNASLADYSSVNWVEIVGKNTIGAKNTSSTESSGSDSKQSGQAQSNVQSQQVTLAPVHIPVRGDVLINEIVSDPEEGEKEWIELYNPTRETIELSGWTLEDGAHTSVMLSGTLGATDLKKFFVVDLPSGFLKNNGDMIELRDARKVLIDTVTYGDWDDGELGNNAPRASDPDALARTGDGANTFYNKTDFRITSTPTKGDSNRITNSDDTSSRANTSLMISEILPNPASQKPNDEFIELYNAGTEPVNLDGWGLATSEGRTFFFSAKNTPSLVVDPKSYVSVSRAVTNLVLKNHGGDRVRLFPSGSDKSIATLIYHDDAPLGMSYARVGQTKYEWTRTPTPGAKNTITQNNQPPEVVLNADEFGRPGEFMTFDASDSDDPDGDSIDVTWNFGDGASASGEVVNHTYEKAGQYILVLSVGDGTTRSVVTKTITIASQQGSARVSSRPQTTPRGSHASPAPHTVAKAKKGVLGEKVARTSTTQHSITAKIMSLSDVRHLPRGTHVTVSAVVAVEPSVLSDSYFYVAGSGIQVSNPKKEFPELHRGDRVTIRGVVKKNGEDMAIMVGVPSDVRRDSGGKEPEPHAVAPKDIGESVEGWLVRITGVVQKVQWPNIYIEHDGSQARVYVAPSTHIARLPLEQGESITVQGIVSQTKTGFRILPRDAHDFSLPQTTPAKTNEGGAPKKESDTQAPSQPFRSLIRYGIVALAAVLVLVVGLLIERLGKRSDGG